MTTLNGIRNGKRRKREISDFGFRSSNFVNSEIRNPKSEIRPAFTLIELLVVTTIIAILATLTLQVVGGLVGQARETATKTTISKIQSLLNSRAQAFQRLTMRKGYLTGSLEYQKLSGNGYTASLQKTLALKQLQIKFFPQTRGEVELYQGQQPNIDNNANATNPEVLYDFLTQANVLGDSPLGTDAFSAAEVQDADKGGLPEFVDGWGNSIRFYRWPTRLFRHGGQTAYNAVAAIDSTDSSNVRTLFSTLPVFTGNLGPDPNLTLYPSATGPLYNTDLDRDPDDPLRECQYNYSTTVKFEDSYHTPATFHVFLVVSAGPDGQFGMYAPDDKANYGHLGAVQNQTALMDDIISLNIRAGGK